MTLRHRPRTLTDALAALDAVALRVEALEHGLTSNRKELDIQFKRIAQLQAELDEVRAMWAKMRA